MSWSVVAKAAVAAVILSAAASLLGTAMLMVGLPLLAVQIAMVSAAAVAAAVVSGTVAINALRAGTELVRARLQGVLGVGTAGVFIGLFGFGNTGAALWVGAGVGVVGWIGARVATSRTRLDGPEQRPDAPPDPPP